MLIHEGKTDIRRITIFVYGCLQVPVHFAFQCIIPRGPGSYLWSKFVIFAGIVFFMIIYGIMPPDFGRHIIEVELRLKLLCDLKCEENKNGKG